MRCMIKEELASERYKTDRIDYVDKYCKLAELRQNKFLERWAHKVH